MDYADLRREGLRLLERMAGGRWTDFNVHDPGITILEQLCYALSDLAYRADFEIPDLLADGGGDAYHSLHPPDEILTCRPVTLADLRRLVLDVAGVRNAWSSRWNRTPWLCTTIRKKALSALAPAQCPSRCRF